MLAREQQPMYLLATIAMALLIDSSTTTTRAAESSVGEFLQKPSLNVVVVVADMEKAKQFYGEVLGLESMPPIRFGDKSAKVLR